MQVLSTSKTQALVPTLGLSPSPGDIRVQLERILSSPEFQVPARGRAFLRYVVEETLSGRADRIKGYNIAIEVFDRNEGFTQDDPVVRIEAGRLRRALERYYLVSGQLNPIRIEIPKGGYVPIFTSRVFSGEEPTDAKPAVVPETSNAARLPRLRARWLVTAALIFLVGFVAIAYWMSGLAVFQEPSPSRRAADLNGPTLVIAPFADLGEGPEAKIYALGLTEELLSVLPRFKELRVFGRETSEALSPQVGASHVREQLGARYLISGGVQVFGNRIRATARLIETETGAILWSQSYDEDLTARDFFAIQSDIANKVATVVAQPYGVIYQAEVAHAPPDDLDAYLCTLRFYGYRAILSDELHAEVRQCLERAVARFPSYATAWAMLSIAYLDEDRFAFNPRAGTPTALERSLDAARKAVELDSQNVRGLQALMMARFANQQLAQSIKVGEQALALNPNDTELIGEFGTRVAMGGQWKRGVALMQDALARNPGGSGYYHAILAVAAYMQQDNEMAVAEIRQANLQKFPNFHIMAAVIYAEAGMTDEAKREGKVFVELRPAFMPNIEAELKKRNFQAADRIRLLSGLRKAGLLPPADATASSSPEP
jgi:adenylate cyclase